MAGWTRPVELLHRLRPVMPCHPTFLTHLALHYSFNTLFSTSLPSPSPRLDPCCGSPSNTTSTGLPRDLALAARVPVVNTHSLSHARQLSVDPGAPLQYSTSLFYLRCEQPHFILDVQPLPAVSFETEQCKFLLGLQMISLYCLLQ
jgi:hypothetical protein